MAEGYQIRNQEAAYYLTFQVINWIDVFSRKEYRDIIIDSFMFCREKKGLKVHGFVIMSNHIHCILSSNIGDLSGTIRDFKTFTSKSIISQIQQTQESRKEWILGQMKYFAKHNKRNSEYQFWTQENHPEELFSDSFTKQKLNYIHYNPVRAGIVEEPPDYIYSSARAYSGLRCLMEVDLI